MLDDNQPSQEELAALEEDVAYEVRQFRYSAARSSELSADLARLAMERNAHVESMLIHARCLVDFFRCMPRKDDVVATHYIADWSPEKDGGDALAWLEEQLGVFIDKRVAHLTCHRCRVDKKSESNFTEDVVRNVEQVVGVFRERLPDRPRAKA